LAELDRVHRLCPPGLARVQGVAHVAQ
jgi:hypothetical protein